MFLVLLSSTTFGSKKNVKTNFCFSLGFSVCFSKQKHPIIFKYRPKDEGDTLKEAEPEEILLPGFYTLNFTVCISPGFRSIVFFSG